MSIVSRVALRWLTAYETKSGQDIELMVSAAKADGRGWVVQTTHAKVNNVPAGYLKFAYIPRSEFNRLYPTAVHHAATIGGRAVGDISTPAKLREAMLKILGFAPDATITTRKLTNLFNKTYGGNYLSFEDYHVDKPQIEYVKSEVLRQGVGVAMYEFTARLLSNRGLSLWSSGTQSHEAKTVWAAMEARGYPVRPVPSPWNGTRLTLSY